MTMRMTNGMVISARAYTSGAFSKRSPAKYSAIEIDGDLLDQMSFPLDLPRATLTQLIAEPRRPGITECSMVDPRQLEAALAVDAAQVPMTEPGDARQLTAPGFAEDGTNPDESVADLHPVKVEP